MFVTTDSVAKDFSTQFPLHLELHSASKANSFFHKKHNHTESISDPFPLSFLSFSLTFCSLLLQYFCYYCQS